MPHLILQFGRFNGLCLSGLGWSPLVDLAGMRTHWLRMKKGSPERAILSANEARPLKGFSVNAISTATETQAIGSESQ
jgi:hypothetical protein